jgi:hypothetical protein
VLPTYKQLKPDNSANKFTFLLLTLLVMFGIFYFLGSSVEIFVISTYKDLWANLLASMVVIIFVERLTAAIKLRKDRASQTYVKEQIRIALFWLQTLGAPRDWQNKIDKPYIFKEFSKEWRDFLEIVQTLWDKTLHDLEDIVVKFSNDLDQDLRNDLFTYMSLLSYMELQTRGVVGLHDLEHVVGLLVVAISKAEEITEKHNLFKCAGGALVDEGQEIPRFVHGIGWKHNHSDEGLKEIMKFRDEIKKRTQQTT